MTTRLVNLVVDAADPAASTRWWAEALGWEVTLQIHHEVDVEPPAGSPGIPLVFVPVPGPKSVPNRVHLDLASSSAEAQATLVDRLRGLGATPADVGQGQVPGPSWPIPRATSCVSCLRADDRQDRRAEPTGNGSARCRSRRL